MCVCGLTFRVTLPKAQCHLRLSTHMYIHMSLCYYTYTHTQTIHTLAHIHIHQYDIHEYVYKHIPSMGKSIVEVVILAPLTNGDIVIPVVTILDFKAVCMCG